jgi:putative endonuclease
MADRKTKGNHAEQIAADYLKAFGYQIVNVNWRCARGEIDIIARQGETLVFVEVRSRLTIDAALESVNARKQGKLQRLAYLYLEETRQEHVDWRIDVVAVSGGREPKIEHVENALDW